MQLSIGKKCIDNRKILICVAIFYVVFFPTSIAGKIMGYIWVLRNLFGFLIAIILASHNIIKKKTLTLVGILLLFLSILTITTDLLYANNDFEVSWSSLSGFLPTLLIWTMTFRDGSVDVKFGKKIIAFLSIAFCIWGWGLVFQNGMLNDITKGLYSQLNDNMYANMVEIRGKPVMSFGTHSMAAFFILIVYFYNCVLIKEQKNTPLTYAFLVVLFLLEIPLDSNTAVLSMVVMLFLLIWARNTAVTRIISIVIITIGVGYALYDGFIIEFVSDIVFNAFSDSHGFQGRYLSGIYDGNFYMMKNYLGVGFLRSDSRFFRMNDSGIIYLLTQGGLPALIITYYLMYNFFKRNIRKYHKITFCIFFIWEIIATTTFISVKMVFAHILTMFLINSICSTTGEQGEVYGKGDCRPDYIKKL